MVASPYAVIDHSKVHNKTKQLDVGDADYEQQVSLARKERRMVDSRVQELLNRISFLRAEEAKLDRDFLRTQQRTEEMLLMKAERTVDDDVYAAARDVLDNLQKRGPPGKKRAAETHPRRAPAARPTHQGKDASPHKSRTSLHTPQLPPSLAPAQLTARPATPSSRRSSSSGCSASSPAQAAMGRKPSLMPGGASAQGGSMRSALARPRSDSGTAAHGPRPNPLPQQLAGSGSGSGSGVPRQQQRQLERPCSGWPPTAPLAPSRSMSASARDRAGRAAATGPKPLARCASEGSSRILAAPAPQTASPQRSSGAAGVQPAPADESAAPCRQLEEGESGGSCGSRGSLRAEGGGGGELPAQQQAEEESWGACCAGGSGGSRQPQLVLLPPGVDACPEIPEDLGSSSAAAAGAGGMVNQMLLLSQGIAAPEVPDEDGSAEAACSGATVRLHPAPLTGLQQFSTQEVPRVVHAKASAPKQAHAAPPATAARGEHAHTAVLGVGWGMGALRLGAAPERGPAHPQPSLPPASQPPQAPPRAPPSVSKALRPSSSLAGRAGSAKAASAEREAAEDIRQRQQIWALRRTFGLAPIVMHDSTAQLEECGAGAWS